MKCAAALLIAMVFIRAQTSSTISLSNGVQIEIAADFGHPTGQEQLTVEMARASGNSFYRIFRDQNKLAVYAYELSVSLAPNGTAVVGTAKPAGDDFAARFPNADAGKPTPTLGTEVAFGPLQTGKDARLQLFEIPGMGLDVSETLRAKLNQTAAGRGALRFGGLRVSQDHKLISGPAPPASVSGKYVMFYLPGRGGYFFSSEPVTGRPFVNTGVVDHAHMLFRIENEDYDCTADAPILPGADGGQVWVYHDPSYVPSGNWTQDPNAQSSSVGFFTAAADSLSWWLQ